MIDRRESTGHWPALKAAIHQQGGASKGAGSDDTRTVEKTGTEVN